jgi:uncharacterized membrane protein YedE/YeeE
MRKLAVAFVCGLVFAVGLGVSGMTNPEKIIGFLDVTGRWDPTLAFVMAGAVGVHMGVAQWARRAARPLWSNTFAIATRSRIDRPLLVGAALFGLGWGVVGYCPGPALVDLGAPSTTLVLFVAAMVAGTLAFQLSRSKSTDESARQATNLRRDRTTLGAREGSVR